MKRRLTKLVLFLLLGAIVNVGVAWGCAIWSDASAERTARQPAPAAFFDQLKRDGWQPRPAGEHWQYVHSIHERRGFGVSWQYVVEEAVRKPNSLGISGPFYSEFLIAVVSQTGWPLRSLSCDHLDRSGNGMSVVIWSGQWPHPQPRRLLGDPIDHRDQTPISNWDRSMSLQLPPKIGLLSLPYGRVLPLRPLWSGFVINSILYALILWLLPESLPWLYRPYSLSPLCRPYWQ